MAFNTMILKSICIADILIQYITPIVIILTFIVERSLNHFYFKTEFKKRRNEFNTQQERSYQLAKNAWVANVIIQPNNESIEKFYTEVCKHFKSSVNNLRAKHTTLSHPEYLNMIIESKREFKKKKRAIEFKFIYLIRSHDVSVANKLTKTLNDLDDLIVKEIGTTDYQSIDLEETISNVQLNKIEFLKNVFSLISIQKN